MKPKISTRLRDDVMALMDHFIKIKAKEGETWSPSRIANEALNDANFLKIMRLWDAGTEAKSPTLDRISRFEAWIAEALGKPAYDEFRRSRAKQISGE